jgi:hypothetical protein
MSNTSLLGSYGGLGESSLQFRNALVNGGFDVWQRGTTPGTMPNEGGGAGLYVSADRWKISGHSSGITYMAASLTQVTTALPVGSRYGARLRSTTAANDDVIMVQIVEAANAAALVGQLASISLKLKKQAGYNAASPIVISLYRLNTVDTAPTILAPTMTGATLLRSYNHTPATSDWETVSFSTTSVLPAEAANGLVVAISYSKTDMGIGDIFDIAQVQLEAGPTATPFERRPYGVELGMCQRYYFIMSGTVALASGFARTSTVFIATVAHPVQMRTPPIISSNTTNGNAYCNLEVGSADWGSMAIAKAGGNNSGINASSLAITNGGANMTVGQGGRAMLNNASAYVDFSAEL